MKKQILFPTGLRLYSVKKIFNLMELKRVLRLIRLKLLRICVEQDSDMFHQIKT